MAPYTRLTQAALATIPFVEALPDPHIMLDVAVPKLGEPNYREPTYMHDMKPFYIPPNFLAIMDNTDQDQRDLGPDQPRCWTRPSWGWVGFRIDYSHTDDEWAAVKKRVWERYRYNRYSDVEKFRILWIEDSSIHKIRNWLAQPRADLSTLALGNTVQHYVRVTSSSPSDSSSAVSNSRSG
ncbi:hypothetical protein B0H34DRAFT_856240 [Crassisporium funariophilum]|nr:hypothetical protein B0H34DRAFT_856240 [Crassisporium funariophilum]